MRLPLLLAAALLVAAAPGAGAETDDGPGTLVVTGSGGQSAVLEVRERTLSLDYRLDDQPRVPGADGAVGGLLLQRLPDRSLYGALLLTNVPGFDGAAGLGLVGGPQAELPRGRYAVTLLGTGPQRLVLDVDGRDGRTALTATGTPRTLTTGAYGSSPVSDDFSEEFAITTPSTLLAMSMGSAGGVQQASSREWCLSRVESRNDACLFAQESRRSTSLAQTDGAVWDTIAVVGMLRRGRYVFAGQAAGVGAGTAAHAVVVIDLPQPPRP